jgi:hypothetical protein
VNAEPAQPPALEESKRIHAKWAARSAIDPADALSDIAGLMRSVGYAKADQYLGFWGAL